MPGEDILYWRNEIQIIDGDQKKDDFPLWEVHIKKKKDLDVVIYKWEADALNVLQFMASNGLVANPRKTSLVILNQRKIQSKLCANIAC